MDVFALVISMLIVVFDGYSLADNCGMLKGKYDPDFPNYYTNLSNVATWLYFVLLLAGHWSSEGLYRWLTRPVVAMTVMLAILVTNLVYHFLLSGEINRNWAAGTGWNPYRVSNLTLHYGVPLATLLYWVLFADKAGLRYTDALIWLIFPLLFVIYSMLHGYYGHYRFGGGEHYPYGFMDIDKQGKGPAIRNIIIVACGFYVLGLLAVFIGHMLG